ncbi:MAG: hypothetical protein AMS14_03500 [Planctomycetes bacterium DG_20]|nr:MAG: hypothetical protein AMS14_03500 [Planctomycetes bacterium DG_20]
MVAAGRTVLRIVALAALAGCAGQAAGKGAVPQDGAAPAGADSGGGGKVSRPANPGDVPLQVTGLEVFHRAGQTFITWQEVDPPVTAEETTWGEVRRALAEHPDAVTYVVYAHDRPITSANLKEAGRVAEVGPLSAYNTGARNMEYLIGQAMIRPDAMGELARDYNGYMYTWGMDSPRMDRCPVRRFVIRPGGGPLPAGSGLYVHHPATPGRRYYAVVSSRAGAANTRDVSKANALAEPVEETVGPGEPVHQGPGLWGPYFDYPGRRQVYVQWCGPPLAPRPNMAFNWSVLVPPGVGEGEKVPAELYLHTGNFSYAKPRKKYMRGSVQIAPHDYPFSGWYGYHEAWGTPGPWGAGTVHNHTQRRIIAFLDWAQRTFPMEPDRTIVCGSDGAAMLAMAYRNRFAYALIWGFGGRSKERHGRVLDPGEAPGFASAWGPRSPDIRDEHGRAEWGWAMLDRLALERPEVSMPLLVCEGPSWGGVRQYGKGYGPFYTNAEQARQPLVAGFGWDTKLISPDYYTGRWQPRRHLDAAALDLTRTTPVLAFANSSASAEKLQHGNVNYKHVWSDLEETPERFRVTLGGEGTVDVTPRRLGRFRVRPGGRLAWRTEPQPDKRDTPPPTPQGGTATVDAHGLFTVKGVEIPRGGTVLTAVRAR